MYVWRHRKEITGFLLIGAAVCGWALDLDLSAAKKIRYPDYDAQGQLKFEVMGDEAKVLPDGLIRIVNLKLIFYEKGKVVMEVTAPECLLDRVKHVATSTSDVRMERPEMILTGRGYEFTWGSHQGHLEIHDSAKVVLKRQTP